VRIRKRKPFWVVRELFQRLLVVVGAVVLTLIFFLVLPLMQTIAKPPTTDLLVQAVDTAKLEAPDPPPVEPEQEEQPEPESRPPELTEEAPLLDLTQLELALNPSFNEGLMVGDFAVNLKTIVSSDSKDVDALFSIADLDQKPRVIYQPGPTINKEMRKKAPGKVYIVFIVDQRGRVANPIIQESTDPVFEKPALNSVKRWKFEPGKRSGQAVRFRMRVPIIFPKGS
jgi:protein TonB